LIDHANRRRRRPEGNRADEVELLNLAAPWDRGGGETLAFYEALDRLRQECAEAADVAEQILVGGFSQREIATSTGRSTDWVSRNWRYSHAWLQVHLGRLK